MDSILSKIEEMLAWVPQWLVGLCLFIGSVCDRAVRVRHVDDCTDVSRIRQRLEEAVRGPISAGAAEAPLSRITRPESALLPRVRPVMDTAEPRPYS
jgi:hypothetical protein